MSSINLGETKPEHLDPLRRTVARAGLDDLQEKLAAGARLDAADGHRLMTSPSLLAVGALADLVRRRGAGDRVCYSRYLNLNYSNVCVNGCRFCAFARAPGAEGGYTLRPEEMEERVARAQVDEIHMVGGLHPSLGLEDYEDLLRRIKAAAPRVFVKAFTAVEVDHMARREKLPVDQVLTRLKAAGLDSMPGGGAEIFSPRVREILCPNKMPGRRWLEVMETAHSLGIPTNATMLYGHVETPEERVAHLLELRALQDRTGGFKAFVPLAFHPANTGLSHLPPPTGFDDLRVIAVSRLMLDNIPHLKALWMYLGLKMAQVALSFGADDLGGTAERERIARAAGAREPEKVTAEELERTIREAGRTPVRTHSGYLLRESGI